jgi:tetratricopeptide (TPR) repeat protein
LPRDIQAAPVALSYRDPNTQVPRNPERTPVLILILLLSWTVAGYIIFREQRLKFWWDRSFLDWTINPIMRSTGADRFLLPVALFGRYMALLLFPLHLAFDYGARVIMPTVSPTDPYLFIGIVSIVILTIAFIIAIRRRAYSIAFCLFAFGLFYSVASNLLTLIGVNFAERLMYIPSVFFLILIARVLATLRRPVLIPLAAGIVALLSCRTVAYAWRWNDRLRLYEYTLAHQPASLRLHLLLAEELRERHQYDRAEGILAQSRQMQPDYFKLWIDSALNQVEKGDRRRAYEFLIEANKLRPSVSHLDLYRQLSDEFPDRVGVTRESHPASRPATVP